MGVRPRLASRCASSVMDGYFGVLSGYALAQLLGTPLVLLAAMPAVYKCQRAATCAQSVACGHLLVVDVMLANWLGAVFYTGVLALIWSWDYLCRPGGWCDTRLQPWFERHVVAPPALSAVLATAYPFLWVDAMRSMPMHSDLLRLATETLPFRELPIEALLGTVLAVYLGSLQVALGLKTRRQRATLLMAAFPISAWSVLAFVLPVDDADRVLVGLSFALVFAIVIWVQTVIEAAPESPPVTKA